MSNRYKTVMIEDLVAHGLNTDQQENLLDLFEYTIKSIAVTAAREAKFNTSDFAIAKQIGCDGFDLLIHRFDLSEQDDENDMASQGIQLDSQNMWYGEFSKGEQTLTVISSLE